MKGKKFGNDWVIRLDKGDEILASLKKFAKENNVYGGFLSGIGAADEIEIGLFDTKEKKYITQKFKGDFEIINLSGNISYQEDDIRLHIHITIADKKQKAYGGHLYYAKISAVCEIFLQQISKNLLRKKDKDSGLYILDI